MNTLFVLFAAARHTVSKSKELFKNKHLQNTENHVIPFSNNRGDIGGNMAINIDFSKLDELILLISNIVGRADSTTVPVTHEAAPDKGLQRLNRQFSDIIMRGGR